MHFMPFEFFYAFSKLCHNMFSRVLRTAVKNTTLGITFMQLASSLNFINDCAFCLTNDIFAFLFILILDHVLWFCLNVTGFRFFLTRTSMSTNATRTVYFNGIRSSYNCQDYSQFLYLLSGCLDWSGLSRNLK